MSAVICWLTGALVAAAAIGTRELYWRKVFRRWRGPGG